MKADGFSLDDKRTPVAENDIPDIIERFKNREKEVDRKRTEQSFMVPKKDIVENEYDLSINKYKEVEYIPVEYPPTSEIMANIRELENEIGKEMDELEKLLKMQRELISTQPQYSYSQQAIDFIYEEIKKHRVRYSMTGRINYQKKQPTPGAKDFKYCIYLLPFGNPALFLHKLTINCIIIIITFVKTYDEVG